MTTLKLGSKGNEVKTLQQLLCKKMTQSQINTSRWNTKWDGDFSGGTRNAVLVFQKANGLVADGVVGAKTWAALGVADKPAATEPAGEPKTEHFKLSEFKCHNGTVVPKQYYSNCQKLMNLLEEIRKECGNAPIGVTSGYRTVAYNKNCGGATNSQHLYAAAADITVKGKTPAQVYAICDKLVGSRGGVGKYKNFTHVDVRGNKSRW